MKYFSFVSILVALLCGCSSYSKQTDTNTVAEEISNDYNYEDNNVPYYSYDTEIKEDEEEDEEPIYSTQYYYSNESSTDNSYNYPRHTTTYDSSVGFVHTNVDEFGNISGHDDAGNFYHGRVDDFGNVSIHDYDGNFYNGRVDDYGNVSMHDYNGNYYHGNANGMIISY